MSDERNPESLATVEKILSLIEHLGRQTYVAAGAVREYLAEGGSPEPIRAVIGPALTLIQQYEQVIAIQMNEAARREEWSREIAERGWRISEDLHRRMTCHGR